MASFAKKTPWYWGNAPTFRKIYNVNENDNEDYGILLFFSTIMVGIPSLFCAIFFGITTSPFFVLLGIITGIWFTLMIGLPFFFSKHDIQLVDRGSYRYLWQLTELEKSFYKLDKKTKKKLKPLAKEVSYNFNSNSKEYKELENLVKGYLSIPQVPKEYKYNKLVSEATADIAKRKARANEEIKAAEEAKAIQAHADASIAEIMKKVAESA